jgi:hypothetical protein
VSIDDLSDCIAEESVAITVTRFGAPTMVAGRPSAAGTTSSVAIVASVQPLSSKELQLMPEGMRARGMRKVFTKTQLQLLPMPDRFDYGGSTWEIIDERDWLDIGNYYRYLAVKVTFG